MSVSQRGYLALLLAGILAFDSGGSSCTLRICRKMDNLNKSDILRNIRPSENWLSKNLPIGLYSWFLPSWLNAATFGKLASAFVRSLFIIGSLKRKCIFNE